MMTFEDCPCGARRNALNGAPEGWDVFCWCIREDCPTQMQMQAQIRAILREIKRPENLNRPGWTPK